MECKSSCFIIIQILSLSFYQSTALENEKSRRIKWKVKQEFMYISDPEQIHITFGDRINDIVVIWATRAVAKTPFVQYGTTSDDILHARAETVQLETSNENGAKYWHRAVLPNLRFGEKYYYRMTSEKGSTDSEVYSFTVPIVPKGTVNSFMILADMGLQTKWLEFLLYEAKDHDYKAVFHIGDITEGLHRNHGKVGETFLNGIQKLTVSIPYLTCPGDHEKFNDFLHYRYKFSMPHTPWPMPRNHLWYSFDFGLAHFISINTEAFVTANDLLLEQIAWLEKDLEITNSKRMEHPWIIILGHRPLYSSCHEEDAKCNASSLSVRRYLDDILFKYGVDLYIGGHDHHYERTFPVYNSLPFGYNYKNAMATVHLTIGSMGANVHKSKFHSLKKSWSAFIFRQLDKELYGRLDVINASHLLWEVFNANNNARVDRTYMIQWRHGSFGEPGKEAYQLSMERKKIPLRPPIPFGYESKRQRDLKSQGYLGPANNMLISSGASGRNMILSVITIVVFILLVVFFSRRMKKKLLSCCTLCTVLK